MSATPEQIAAAWGAWRVRHKGSMGPGPGFVEAINAALAVSPETRSLVLEEAAALIEKNVIQDTSAGKVLRPRQEGNQDGLHYAAAIRTLERIGG